ncbi:MAG: hypothetical protein ACUVTB_06320 [Candidatus Bathycorpusculaceae bacterium]
MAIFLLDTWVPIKGKEKENEQIAKKILQYGSKHPDISKYAKSLRYFKQGIGGKPPGRCVLITEFSSLSDMEKFFTKLQNEIEWQKLRQEWADVMDKNTVETMIWNDKERELWTEK